MKKSLLGLPIAASTIFLSTWSHSEPSARVLLTVAHNITNAIVSWPYPSTGFGLEFSTKLGTTGWQPAAGTPVSNNRALGSYCASHPVGRILSLASAFRSEGDRMNH